MLRIRRPNGDELRVTRAEYRGEVLVHVRVWYQKAGEWLPGRAGIPLREDEVAEVASALSRIAGKLPS